jgi:Oxidoreductase family, NAD-binding Rossmann fold/Barrel-sandwich domain of CusB or HlyD membrane-fusion
MAAPLTKRGMAPCSTISLQPEKPSLESPLSKTDPYFGTWGGLALIQKEIRVGIVGADARASWAKVPHVPAIKGLPGLKLVAVATRNERSAREAAEAFGADRWFSDPFAMLRDDRIDVVTIAVKVPAHRALVLAAPDAGKAVYCEAPLGRTVAETEEMASAVGSLPTAIGLQGPAVRRAAQLLCDGVITQRNVDVGALVQGNATSGTFMFEIMQEDVIRVRTYVPQDAAFDVAPGIEAVVRVPELPDREFPGTVTRIADALQPGTRTLLTEVDIPNPDGALAPGIYCTVELHIPRKMPSLSVPAEAIIFNRNGMQVAVVSSGKAEMRKVRVKRDLGARVEVDAGINAGDQVILNPPVNLVDGNKVQPRTEAAADR